MKGRRLKQHWAWKYILKDTKGADRTEKEIHKRYRLKHYFRTKQKSVFPLVMMFETSARCNINCVMCPRSTCTRNLNGSMPYSTFKKVLDQVADHPPCQITLHYSGEPLLCPDLPKMIRYAKDVGVPFVRFNTNGMLLNEPTAKELIESGLDKLTVALEATPYIHNLTRRGSSYSKVVDNILDFLRVRRDLGATKPALWIQMLTSKYTNENHIYIGIKRWEKIVDYVEVASVATIGNQVEDFGTVRDNIECYECYTTMAVLWNGDVVPCCVDHDAQLKMGNVNKSSVEEIWNNAKWEELRFFHKVGAYENLPLLCQNCVRPLTWVETFKRGVAMNAIVEKLRRSD